MKEIDGPDLARRLAQLCEVELAVVEVCLAVEAEYLAAIGVMRRPEPVGWAYRYYSLEERAGLVGAPAFVDIDRLSSDCSRLGGVPAATAMLVLDAETELLTTDLA